MDPITQRRYNAPCAPGQPGQDVDYELYSKYGYEMHQTYRDAVVRDDRMPAWHELSLTEQSAWFEVGKAIARIAFAVGNGLSNMEQSVADQIAAGRF